MELLSKEEKLRFLKTLQSDEEFRYAIAGLLGMDAILNELKKLREDFNKHLEYEERRWEENNKRWEENAKRWEENNKRWEENNRRWEENAKRWEENAKRWEENNKRWEENAKRWEENNRRWEEAMKRFEAIELELKSLREDFNRAYTSFERKLIALGARWGINTEEAFRNAMRGIVEELLGVAKVDKWVYFDANGEVLGYPTIIEVDVAIKNGEHILVEVKSSASSGDISKLWKEGILYAKVTGVKPKLVLVTPFIDEKGLEAADKLGVKVYKS